MGGDVGFFLGYGFEVNEVEVFVLVWEGEDVVVVNFVVEIGVVDVIEEVDGVVEVEFFGDGLEVGEVVVVIDYVEVSSGDFLVDLWYGFDEVVDVFVVVG